MTVQSNGEIEAFNGQVDGASPFDRIRQADRPAITALDFRGAPVRMFFKGEDPYWILQDVCTPLGQRANDVARRLDDDEKITVDVRELGFCVSDTQNPLGGNPNMTAVNLSGVARVLARSDSPLAKPFQDWLFEEVVPRIFKTGGYQLSTRKRPLVEGGPWTERFRQSYYDHLYYVRKHCDLGDFTVVTASVGDLLGMEVILLQHEIRLFSTDLPDGSIGLRWANHLREIGLYKKKGDAPLRLFDPVRRVRPSVYALDLLPEYLRWFRAVYLVRGVPAYFGDKFVRRQGVP